MYFRIIFFLIVVAYYCPNWHVTPVALKTNKAMNTACRSPGKSVSHWFSDLPVRTILSLNVMLLKFSLHPTYLLNDTFGEFDPFVD